MSRSAITGWAAVLSAALALSACSSSTGVEQSNEVVEDVFGCPALNGTYSVQMPDAETGLKLDGSVFETLGSANAERIPLQAVSGVAVQSDETGAMRFRFFISDERVMQQLDILREFSAPRYADWYRVQQQPARAEFVARHGEEAYRQHVAKLGPQTAVTLELQRGKDFTCADGWVELPRAYGEPIRLTLGENGNLVAQSRELSTYGITVWCGDGCKELPIPTGTYIGGMVWPKAAGMREWTADGMANRFVFQRPVQDIQAEQAQFAANTAAYNARRYASFGDIRARFAAIAPEGVEILNVEFVDSQVRVTAGFPEAVLAVEDQRARIQWMIAAVEQRHPRFLDDKDVVKRVVSSGGTMRHEVDFTLRDSPLVLVGDSNEQTGPAAAAASDSPSLAADSAQTAVVLQPLPLVPSVRVDQAVAQVALAAPGMASGSALEKRLSAYLASGCSITSVRNSGDRVFVVGSASSMRAVSESLRALDSAAAPASNSVELVSIEQQSPDAYRFEMMLRRSALTAE